MDKRPTSAANPRLDNKPYFIHHNCTECRTALVLKDILDSTDQSSDEIWHDEFICPVCRDELYLDWPKSKKLNAQI